MSILSREEAQTLAQRILDLSRADECRVSLTSGLQANTRFADNGVTTSGDATNDVLSPPRSHSTSDQVELLASTSSCIRPCIR